MTQEPLSIPFESRHLSQVSGLLQEPEGERRGAAVLLAHGAGYDMEAPWMGTVAEGLVARGFGVLRFNYPYKERQRIEGRQKPPDRAPVLEGAHAAALEVLRARLDGRRVLLAGKSLGGRMSTHLAARGEACDGLVLFGYPLHPPGKPERLRKDHFPDVRQPALFLQGTRDKLCDLELLDEALQTFGGEATVEVIDDADHSFHVPKRSGRTDAEVLESLLDRVARWDDERFG